MFLTVGGVILCGGKSTRMGVAKALLPFGEELMLQRVARLLSQAVRPIVVVAAAGQQLPDLPPELLIARDQRQDQGPLEGLRVGIEALAERQIEAVYATSCDAPLLSPAFVKRMIELLGEHEIAVVRDGQFHHPLAAVYRTRVALSIEQLLSEGRRRPFDLLESCRTREVPLNDLRAVDPQLQSLTNCNRPADYVAALAAAGFSLPAEVARAWGADQTHEGV